MKKFMVCLGILVFILGFGGMVKADQFTFNFNPSALPDGSGGTAIGTYMTGIYGSTVTATGESISSEVGGLLGGTGDGYIESEPFDEHLIQFTFATPITSVVSFDYGAQYDPFNADYFDGTWHNFFHHNETFGSYTGSTTYDFGSSLVTALRFHDEWFGEVGIDNLVVNSSASVPEPGIMLLLGSGLLGLGFFGRRRFKK